MPICRPFPAAGSMWRSAGLSPLRESMWGRSATPERADSDGLERPPRTPLATRSGFRSAVPRVSARPARRRDAEIGADLAHEPEIDLAIARHGCRALGVEAPEAAVAAFRAGAAHRGRAGGARGHGASRADDKLERFAVCSRSDRRGPDSVTADLEPRSSWS
jgi:hypothetical protein